MKVVFVNGKLADKPPGRSRVGGPVCVIVCLAFAAVACDERSPAAPVPQTSRPAEPILTRTGVVRDERGASVAGATVWAMPPGVRVLTDVDGRFVVPAVGGMIWMYAAKGGYEPDSQETLAPERDLTLHDILRIHRRWIDSRHHRSQRSVDLCLRSS